MWTTGYTLPETERIHCWRRTRAWRRSRWRCSVHCNAKIVHFASQAGHGFVGKCHSRYNWSGRGADPRTGQENSSGLGQSFGLFRWDWRLTSAGGMHMFSSHSGLSPSHLSIGHPLFLQQRVRWLQLIRNVCVKISVLQGDPTVGVGCKMGPYVLKGP